MYSLDDVTASPGNTDDVISRNVTSCTRWQYDTSQYKSTIVTEVLLTSYHTVVTTVLIPVRGSQPAGDVSHKPGGRLPLPSTRPAITPASLKRAATNLLYE